MAAGVVTSIRSRVLIGVVITVALAACSTDNSRSAESDAVIPHDPGRLSGTEWVLVETGDSDAVPAATPMTLDIGNGAASGNGPCNRYNVPFTYDGNDLTTGPVAATKIACPARQANAERKFFHWLEVADTIEIESDRLVLSGPDDARLVFARNEPADDIEGKWRIVAIATASAVQTAVRGTSPSLDFRDDGTLTIETGCNNGGSTWKADGTALTIGAVRATQMACSSPPGVSEQESNIFAALPRTAKIEHSRFGAVLVDEGGLTLLVLDRDS